MKPNHIEALSAVSEDNVCVWQRLYESYFAEAYQALHDYNDLPNSEFPNIDIDLAFDHDEKKRICKLVAEEMANKKIEVASSVDFDGIGAWNEMVEVLLSIVSDCYEKKIKEVEEMERNFKVNRGEGFEDFVLCEMYKLEDDNTFTDGEEFDIGDYSACEWVVICRKAVEALIADIERRANANDMEYPTFSGIGNDGWQIVDYTYEVFENGPKILKKILKEDWEKRHPAEEYDFTISANAFLTLSVKGRSREEAKETALRMIESADFVREHYTEFEIEGEAVMHEDL